MPVDLPPFIDVRVYSPEHARKLKDQEDWHSQVGSLEFKHPSVHARLAGDCQFWEFKAAAVSGLDDPYRDRAETSPVGPRF